MVFEIGEMVGIECPCSPKSQHCRRMGTVQSVLVPPPASDDPRDIIYRLLFPLGHYLHVIPAPEPPGEQPQWIPVDWLRKLPPLPERVTATEEKVKA